MSEAWFTLSFLRQHLCSVLQRTFMQWPFTLHELQTLLMAGPSRAHSGGLVQNMLLTLRNFCEKAKKSGDDVDSWPDANLLTEIYIGVFVVALPLVNSR